MPARCGVVTSEVPAFGIVQLLQVLNPDVNRERHEGRRSPGVMQAERRLWAAEPVVMVMVVVVVVMGWWC